jgi:hypothetical protein
MTMQPLRGTTGGRWSRTGTLVSSTDYLDADVLAALRTHRTEVFRYEQHRIVGGVWTVIGDVTNLIKSCRITYDGHGEHFMQSATMEINDPSHVINFLTDAIRVFHLVLMYDGNYVQWMKGTYYVPAPRVPLDFVQTRAIETHDALQVLFESKITDWFVVPSAPPGGGFENGDAINWAKKLILDRYPLAGIDIPDSPIRVKDDPPPAPTRNRSKIYEVGTSIIDVVNSLLLFCGYETLWANPTGSFIAHVFQKLSLRPVDYIYTADSNSLLIRDSGETEQDLWNAPNQWLRVVSRPDAPLLRSRLTLDDPTNPLSTVYRGRTVTDFAMLDAPDQATLDTVVQALYEDGQRVLKSMKVSVPLMPHYHLDKVVMQWASFHPWAYTENGVYIIYGWVFPCVPGGKMELSLELAPFSPAIPPSTGPIGVAASSSMVSYVGQGLIYRIGTFDNGVGTEILAYGAVPFLADGGSGSESVQILLLSTVSDSGAGSEVASTFFNGTDAFQANAFQADTFRE